MFLGEHRHSLDAKGRVIFPSRFREELGAQIVVQKGIEPCLVVLPPTEWERQVAEVDTLRRTDPKSRAYRRFFYSQASNERLDKQGRLTIPQTMRAYAGLERDVVIVGMGTSVELWDAGRWDEQQTETETNVEELSADLGI